jgi:hypothetical protein
LLICNSKSWVFSLAISLCTGCSANRFAAPYVLLNSGYTVDPIWVALNMDGEVFFQRDSCTGGRQSPALRLTPSQQLRLRGAAELLRKLPGGESEVDRRKCPDDELPLKVWINESSGVRRGWSACYSPVDPSFERLPRPFQEILHVIREIPESSYDPLYVFLH